MKKTLSVLLCMCMILGMLPGVTNADEVPAPDWLKDNNGAYWSTLETPGVLVSDYKFTGSDIPGEKIPFTDGVHYKGEYTDDGFKVTKIDDDTSSTSLSNQYGRIPFVESSVDSTNCTETYQYGLAGTYVIDLYMTADFKSTGTATGNRFDLNLDSYQDITYKGSGIKKYNLIRMYANRNFDILSGSSNGSAYRADGAKQISAKGNQSVIRFIIDTDARQLAYYINNGSGYEYVGTGEYLGDVIQGLTFNPRCGFQKGSYVTFNGVKIYKIKDPTKSVVFQEVKEAINNPSKLPESVTSQPYNAVTENLTLPTGEWTSSDEKTITTNGIVTRGYDDEKVVLQKTFETSATPVFQVFKKYNLTVLKRTDINEQIVAEYNFKENADCNKLIYSDKNTTELDSVNGLKIKQTEGAVIDSSEANATGNNAIATVTRKITSDDVSETYISNLSGVYDFEIGVIPSVENKYSDGGKPVTLEAGYYDAETGTFTTYATVAMYNDVARYNSNFSSTYESSITNETVTDVKFKVDTKNSNLWIYVNGKKSSKMEYKGNGYINAFRASVDKNSESTDSITLSDAKVVSLFELDHEEFVNTDIINCIDEVATSLGIDKVTSNSSDAYGTMGDLPETIGDYKVEWSADSQLVDLTDKYIYRTTTDQDMIVTARIFDEENPKVVVTKEFYISVDGTDDPEILLESTKSKLNAKNITNQPADALITDIVLPTEVAGNTVSWESSNPDILSIEIGDTVKGIIAKTSDIDEPTKVTLTATITSNDAEVKKYIDFAVAKRGADVTLYTSATSVETPITGVVTYEADLNGTATLMDSNGKKIVDLDANGTVKVVMDFNNSKVSVFENGVLVSDYIDFAEAAENFASVTSSTVSNEKVILDEYALYSYNIEKFGYLDELGKGVVTSKVEMSSATVGGAVVTWDSKNTAILANDGTYNAPTNVTFFDVDFSITLAGGTGATYSKILNIVAIPEDNIFAGSDVTNQGVSVPAGEYQTVMMFDGNYTDTKFRGSYADETKSIIIDMKNAQDINTMYIANDGLVSCDIYVSDDRAEWTLVAQPEFDGSNNKNLVEFERKNARYVKIDNIVYDGSYLDIYEIAGFMVYDSSDKSYMDIQKIVMPEEYVLTVTSLTLPSTGSIYGSTFTWKSSHPDVISANGTVTKPENNTEVLLTVTSENGTATSTKTFRYYVKGTNGAQGGTSSGGSGGGGGGSIYIGDNSSSAFPETNTTVQTPVASSGKLFEDVEKTDWFYAYVLDLMNENIINGDDNNRFNPNNYVTREEFVKMIVNASGIELAANGKGFIDVNSSAWYAPYVYAAKNNGIVNGTSANTFGVGSPISRQDMSVIINNIIDIDADISTNRDIFKDDSSISAYAYEAVYSMKALGILNGYENGEFNPQGKLTRAEAAKVIAMVVDIIK